MQFFDDILTFSFTNHSSSPHHSTSCLKFAFFLGGVLPVAFAISLVGLAWLSETVRQGVFVMNALDFYTVTHLAAAALGILILRSDLVYLVRRPALTVNGPHPMDWNMSGSVLALLIMPAVLAVPLLYLALEGQSLPDAGLVLQAVPGTFEALFVKALLLAVCAELFFREAALSAFRDSRIALVLASTLAYFVFSLSGGLASALVAAGAGLFYLSLRLMGAHILMVALIHAIAVVSLSIIAPDLTRSMASAIFFTVATAAISLTVLSLSSPKRSALSHA